MIEKLRSRSWGMVTRRECSRHHRHRCTNGGVADDPDELDGVAVAAANHRVIFENERVRVLQVTIPAGETMPLHTHPRADRQPHWCPDRTSSVATSGRDDVRHARRSGLRPPRASYSAPTPRHTIENTGADDLVVIAVELKSLPSS